MATLYFMCGKMAAGKSTFAKKLAANKGAVLLVEDVLLTELYPGEITDLTGYVKYSGRLKTALTATICDLLRRDISVVLDFPANTANQRAWFRQLLEQSGASDQLHYLDLPDTLCRQQLAVRNTGKSEAAMAADLATFEALLPYFSPPTAEENFTLVQHARI